MSRHLLVAASCFATLALSTARAQGPASPPPVAPIVISTPTLGTRVRLIVHDDATIDSKKTRAIVGRLGRLTADSIELYDDRSGIPVAVARGSVERVERRWKRESAAATNGIIGGTLGLAGSGYALWRLCRNGADCWSVPQPDPTDSEDEHPMSFGAASLLAGTALGALAGYVMTPYSWRVTVLPYALGVRGEPITRGLQVAFSIRTGNASPR